MITHGHVFCPVNRTRGLLARSDNAIDCCKIPCAVKGATFYFWLHRSKCSAVGLSPLTGHQLVKEAGGQHRDCTGAVHGVGLLPGQSLNTSGLMPIHEGKKKKKATTFQIQSDQHSGFFLIKALWLQEHDCCCLWLEEPWPMAQLSCWAHGGEQS